MSKIKKKLANGEVIEADSQKELEEIMKKRGIIDFSRFGRGI